MTMSLIIGSAVLSLLCFYFAFNLDEQHFILKLLAVLFGFIFMFMVAVGVAQNTAQYCAVETTSQSVNGSVTTLNNNYICYDTGKTSGSTLINITGGLLMLFSIYVTIYLIYEIFVYKWTKEGR